MMSKHLLWEYMCTLNPSMKMYAYGMAPLDRISAFRHSLPCLWYRYVFSCCPHYDLGKLHVSPSEKIYYVEKTVLDTGVPEPVWAKNSARAQWGSPLAGQRSQNISFISFNMLHTVCWQLYDSHSQTLPSGVLSKIFLREHAPRPPSRRYMSCDTSCQPDQC